VLLVEGDEGVASVAADMISQLGCEVIRVDNGVAALGAIASDRMIDVVLSDIMMPGGMSGSDLAREINRRWPSLPVVLTGYDGQVVSAADQLGLPLLRKPHRLDALAERLTAALPTAPPATAGAR
jgi:CheY-like chemotaxis protein